jgi:hypothetical protein
VAPAHRHVKSALPHLPVGLIVDGLLVLLGVAVLLGAVGAVLHRSRTKADFGAPGLYGVVGRMGGGKSYFLALVAFTARQRGRLIFANYALDGAEKYRSWVEVLSIPHCADSDCSWARVEAGDCPNAGPLVVMDEVHLWFPSEAWRCPVEVTGWLSQLRKHGITMLWASQHDEFVGRRLRRLTFGYWKCVHFRRGHQYTLFDGATFGKAKPERLARMNVVRKVEVMASYNTREIVDSSVEWGDGAGFEQLAVRPSGLGSGRPGPAKRSGDRLTSLGVILPVASGSERSS